TQLSGVIVVPQDCIHSTLYVEQSEPMDGGTGIVGDIYADDIVIEPAASLVNVVGNGGGEAAIPTSGTSPRQGVGCMGAPGTTVFHTGLASVSCTSRTAAATGPVYYLPAGAATYAVSAYVQHTATSGPLDLLLTATLSCAPTATGALATSTVTVGSAPSLAP